MLVSRYARGTPAERQRIYELLLSEHDQIVVTGEADRCLLLKERDALVAAREASDDPEHPLAHGPFVRRQHWLRERDNPEVIAYLEAENAYTEAMTADNRRMTLTFAFNYGGRAEIVDAD